MSTSLARAKAALQAATVSIRHGDRVIGPVLFQGSGRERLCLVLTPEGRTLCPDRPRHPGDHRLTRAVIALPMVAGLPVLCLAI